MKAYMKILTSSGTTESSTLCIGPIERVTKAVADELEFAVNEWIDEHSDFEIVGHTTTTSLAADSQNSVVTMTASIMYRTPDPAS